MTIPYRHAAQLVGLWLFLVLVSLFSRSYIPVDETRYVTVAWNMWLSGDYLVPYLNGIAYSHKPPLLFWLMNLGWAVFGVNDWWPRLVPSLFALGSMWLTLRLAARLWPGEKQIALSAPLILLGCVLWTVFTTATMFDMLVAFFTLLGMLGILIAWQEKSARGWLLLGLAIGGGLLAKGPTILLQLLPLAVLAPWWGRGESRRWWRWYAGILAALALGAVIALAWAIPAGMRGGAAYQHAIFWGQTADRMVQSFAHQRPLWWYLPLLPVMLFPWLLWLPLWRGALRLRELAGEEGVRYCLAWLVPVFLAFSFISGKQVHYLLPIFPAFALIAARAFSLAPHSGRRDVAPVVLAALGAALVLLYVPFYAHSHLLAPWLQDIPTWAGLGLIVGSLVLLLAPAQDNMARIWNMALFSALVATLLNVAVIRPAGPAYDMRPISARLGQLQAAGVPLAHVGDYPGIFNFLGRLKSSPEIIRRQQLSAWFERHPDGRAIVYFDRDHPVGELQPEFLQYYLNQQAGIVNRQQWRLWCKVRPPGSC